MIAVAPVRTVNGQLVADQQNWSTRIVGEIGIRRGFGARRNDILAQFLVEALAVSLIGGALGVMLGVGISLLVARVPLNGQFLEPVISPGAWLLAFGVSATIGLFFGFYPAMRASRLHPIEALRYESPAAHPCRTGDPDVLSS